MEIYDIDIPVIMLTSISEKIYSRNLPIALRKTFSEMRIASKIFSDYPYEESLNIVRLPNFSSSPNPLQTAVEINHIIKEIEVSERLDLIIISIAAGNACFDRKIIEDFGVSAYITSRIVPPDCVIANVFFVDGDRKAMDHIIGDISKVLDSPIDYVNVTNKVIDYERAEFSGEIETVSLDIEMVRKKVAALEEPRIMTVSGMNDVRKLAEMIIEQLERYACIHKM